MKYDIFISYRREGGYDTAKHLNDLLVRDGYRVSFDIDTLRNGDFDTQLLSRIEECKDFILIVDKHAFDRTLDKTFDPTKDWMRCELAHALKYSKNIIPIFLSEVTGFPNGLPSDIVNVTKKNGPQFTQYYFDAFYKRLKEDFILSKGYNVIRECATNRYVVGSLYSENGKQGVVVEVDDSGLHGKIISLEQGIKPWTVDKSEAKRYLGLSNLYDGFSNMQEIKKIANWEYKFPAFGWCAQFGHDWYLPAYNELKCLLNNKDVYEKVNKCLKEVGATQLFIKSWFWQTSKHYCSSTEDVQGMIATAIDGVRIKFVPDVDWGGFKTEKFAIRAFAKF